MSNPTPRSEIRDVTPEWAMSILAKHDKSLTDGSFRQRPIADRTISRYAADMKLGNWALTGQGISFDVKGHLLDGQHRLRAVCRAGVVVRMLILWDLPTQLNSKVSTMDTLDVGRTRNMAQQMRLHGMEYCTILASCSRLLAIMAHKKREKGKLTTPQGLQISTLIQHHAVELIRIIGKENQGGNIRGFILTPLVMLRSAEPDTADLFAAEYSEMANLGKNSPVLLFRKFLNRPTHIKSSGDYQMHVMRALISALWSFTNEKKLEYIKGSDEHTEWLLGVAGGLMNKVREITGE